MDSGAATHEEIWDDSALVDSWNDALAEYKVRHAGMPRAACFETAMVACHVRCRDPKLTPRAEIPQHPRQRRHRRRHGRPLTEWRSRVSPRPPRHSGNRSTEGGENRRQGDGNSAPRSPSNGIHDNVGLGEMPMPAPSLKQTTPRRARWMRRSPWTRATKRGTRQSRMARAPSMRRR